MKLLALDTAANLCAACVFDAEPAVVRAARSLDVGKGHVEHLMLLVQEVLNQADAGYGDLDRIVVSTGPGSFTGVRVGIAAARGLALALNIPVIGISTLEAIAAEVRETHPGRSAFIAIDARRGEVYSAEYDAHGVCVSDPAVLSVPVAAGRVSSTGSVVAGSGARIVAEAVDGDIAIASCSDAATADIEIFARLGAVTDEPDMPPNPLYLRAPDAKPQVGFAVARVSN